MGKGSEVVVAPFVPETQGLQELVDQNNPPEKKTKTKPLKKAWLGHGKETKTRSSLSQCGNGNSMALRTRPTRTTLKQVSNF